MAAQGLSPVLVDVVGNTDFLVQNVRDALNSLETEVGRSTNEMTRPPVVFSFPTVERLIVFRPGDVWGLRRERRVDPVFAAHHSVDRSVNSLSILS
jgi:hypothetical protein